jgi:PAS domain-containing protein
MSVFNRAQRLAWESSVQAAAAALDDPRERTARLRVRLRSAAAGLHECLTALSRAAPRSPRLRRRASRSDARLIDLVQTLPIPYLLTRRDGTILGANDSAATALNVAERALVGRNLLVFLDDRPRWMALLAGMDGTGPTVCVGNCKPRERVQIPVRATLSLDTGSNEARVQWILTGGLQESGIADAPFAASA